MRYTENDPTGQGKHAGYIRTQWAQSPEASFKISDKQQTWLNLFDKPDQVHRLDAQGKSIAIQRYEYDGLGNTKVHVNEREHATHYDFDAWNRMTRTTLADGTRVNRSYTEHSSTELPSQVYVDREADKLKRGQRRVEGPVVLGTRSYDGIDRLAASRTGERQETLLYLKGNMQPDLRTNNAQQKITYDYDLLLRKCPQPEELKTRLRLSSTRPTVCLKLPLMTWVSASMATTGTTARIKRPGKARMAPAAIALSKVPPHLGA